MQTHGRSRVDAEATNFSGVEGCLPGPPGSVAKPSGHADLHVRQYEESDGFVCIPESGHILPIGAQCWQMGWAGPPLYWQQGYGSSNEWRVGKAAIYVLVRRHRRPPSCDHPPLLI